MDDMYPITSKLYPADDEPASMEDLLPYFLKRGSLRVSDLHLKVGMPPCYRIDGALQPVKGPPLTETVIEGLIFSLLGPSEREQLAETGSVDGSFPLDRLQFRFNAFQDADGIAIALRALENDIPAVDALGFPNDVWKDIVGMQQGLALLTGITGSGKSTTISSLINHIAMTRKCRIITLEDPVEYRLKSSRSMISQREVGRHVESFSEGIRAGLREDPDVIFVGEMRDVESARWTLTAAETGHLVFSTLHTRDTRGTLTRLIDMYPANQQDEIASQLSLGLSYVIAQKLVPREDSSAGLRRLGHITKQGPPTARKYLVEVAWQAVRRSPTVRARYERILKEDPKRRKIALVAVARWLVRCMQAMLKTGELWREVA